MKFFLLLASLVALLVDIGKKVVVHAEFTEISSTVPQGVVGIQFPTFCGRKHNVPNVVHTVEPSDTDEISVWTEPADLVTATARGDLLEFRWNRTVSDAANQGGVRIRMPVNQLTRIAACCSANVQIMPGFAGLVSLVVSTSANVRANFAVNGTNAPGSIVSMDVSTSATAQVQGIAQIMSLVTSTSSTTLIKGNVAVLEAGTSSTVTVDGNITGDKSFATRPALLPRRGLVTMCQSPPVALAMPIPTPTLR